MPEMGKQSKTAPVRRDWDNITIADDLMFSTVFSDSGLCKELLEILLGISIDHVEVIQREASFVPEIGARGIRVDVYVADDSGTVFDVEMQTTDKKNLMKRARYYQSAIDMDCISPGTKYKDMRDSYIIFVCTFDPLGDSLPRYTITPHIHETRREVADGTVRMLVNAQAWEECEDARLRDFLRYLTNGTIGDNEFLRRVEDAVRKHRRRPEWREQRMRLDLYVYEKAEELAEELAEDKARDIAQGMAQDMAQGMAQDMAQGMARDMAQGMAQDIAQGMAQDIVQGMVDDAVAKSQAADARLAAVLIEAGRVDEIPRALSDEAFRAQLVKEFGLED